MRTHLIIPDVQAREGVPLVHLEALGNFIVEHKPDVIVCLGDFADMESLCSYDKGKRTFEGRRYNKDIKAAHKAMETLLKPINDYNKQRRQNKKSLYKPEKHLCLGNHEYRIIRVTQYSPEMDGVISISDLKYKEYGWKVYTYNEMVFIDGVAYTHFVKNKNSETPRASIKAAVVDLMHSVTCGHKPILDIYAHVTGDLRNIWGIQAGSFYLHDEDYRGYQGNKHWRGIIYKNNVHNGDFDPTFIKVSNLIRDYL